MCNSSPQIFNNRFEHRLLLTLGTIIASLSLILHTRRWKISSITLTKTQFKTKRLHKTIKKVRNILIQYTTFLFKPVTRHEKKQFFFSKLYISLVPSLLISTLNVSLNSSYVETVFRALRKQYTKLHKNKNKKILWACT